MLSPIKDKFKGRGLLATPSSEATEAQKLKDQKAAQALTKDYLTLTTSMSQGVRVLDRAEGKSITIFSLEDLQVSRSYLTPLGTLVERTSERTVVLNGRTEIEIDLEDAGLACCDTSKHARCALSFEGEQQREWLRSRADQGGRHLHGERPFPIS